MKRGLRTGHLDVEMRAVDIVTALDHAPLLDLRLPQREKPAWPLLFHRAVHEGKRYDERLACGGAQVARLQLPVAHALQLFAHYRPYLDEGEQESTKLQVNAKLFANKVVNLGPVLDLRIVQICVFVVAAAEADRVRHEVAHHFLDRLPRAAGNVSTTVDVSDMTGIPLIDLFSLRVLFCPAKRHFS